MPQSGIRPEPFPTVSPVVKYRSWSAGEMNPRLIQNWSSPGSMSTSALRRAAETTSWLRW